MNRAMHSTPIGKRLVVRMTSIVFLSLAASALAEAAAPSETPPEPRQATVRYGDLDLTRPEGAAMLYRRIAIAARKVCDQIGGKQPQNVARARSCIEHAIADTVARIGSPVLSSYYASRGGTIDAARTASTQP